MEGYKGFIAEFTSAKVLKHKISRAGLGMERIFLEGKKESLIGAQTDLNTIENG